MNERTNDILGERGELIFRLLITKFHANGPLFSTHFLGDKWPLVDFLVTLEGIEARTFFFFVQVKATRTGYTRKDRRLKVKVSREDVLGLAAYPSPTYVIGIDEVNETGYIISANGERLAALPSLNTNYPIDMENRVRLWQEVKAYWEANSITAIHSVFSDSKWR